MPLKECNRMDERLRFVARLLDGDQLRRLPAGRGADQRGDAAEKTPKYWISEIFGQKCAVSERYQAARQTSL